MRVQSAVKIPAGKARGRPEIGLDQRFGTLFRITAAPQVFASDAGTVEWHCLMPRARVRIGKRSGLRYAEHLNITVAPWKLPIRTLRWGRFATPSDWIVWIDWQGEVRTDAARTAPAHDLGMGGDGGYLSVLLDGSIERSAYPPTAAFPSFHVLWAIFVGRLCGPRWLGIGYAAAIAVSCVTTGMHYIPDVLRLTEWVANSWREWRIGPVRLINHGFYAGAAGFIQVMIVTAALGPGRAWKVMVTAIAGLLGAGAWAQWVEGSSRLRRPFGFYGGLIGVGLACLFFEERWTLVAVQCLGAAMDASPGTPPVPGKRLLSWRAFFSRGRYPRHSPALARDQAGRPGRDCHLSDAALLDFRQ